MPINARHLATIAGIGATLAAAGMACAQSGPPVPQAAPNASGQKPAFVGQTRATEQHSELTLETKEVAAGLAHPWAVEFLPDGRMLVTERDGRMRVVSQEGHVSDPIDGLPEVDARDQGGLLDVVLSPSFARDRTIYWSYAELRDGGANGTAVARARLTEDLGRVENVEVIFRQMPSWRSTKHFGSRLVWDGEGHLYVTLGERSLPEPRKLAQDLGTHLGKVVRINPDGSVPEDNPFVGREGIMPEIWTYGHRNIQGAVLHPETGELWTIEHGARGGDELNQPQPGRNYGWPVITYGEDYSGKPIGEGITAREGMEQPVYYWDPVIAPGGMLFYTGDLFRSWKGDLLVASLRPGALVRLDMAGGRVVGEEHLLTDVGRLRDVAQGPDGALWVITDKDDGELLKLTPSKDS
jgi:glucose/arabinose dehydrogenase